MRAPSRSIFLTRVSHQTPSRGPIHGRRRRRRYGWLLLLACLLVVAPLLAADEPEITAEGEESFYSRFFDDPSLGGKLHLTYRINYQLKAFDFKRHAFNFRPITDADREQAEQLKRRHDDPFDHDLDQYFSLRTEDLFIPWEDSGIFQSFGTETAFRYFKDIDGSPQGEAAHAVFEPSSGRDAFQLYKLFLRFETFSKHLELTLGRQYVTEAEWVHFDGVTGRFRGLRILGRDVELTAFGGARVKFYSRSSASRDALGGGTAKIWLGDETRLKFSNVYYLYNTFEAELRQGISEVGWLALRYRQINSAPHSVTLDGHLEWAAPRITVDARYLAKVAGAVDDFYFDYTQSSLRRDGRQQETHFNIGGVEPYDEIFLEVRKGFLERYGILVGGIAHLLRHPDREDNYNTNWYELWMGLDVHQAPWKGFSGHATLRYVKTDLPRRVARLDESALVDGVPNFLPEDALGDGEPSSLGLELLVEQDFERVVSVGAYTVVRSYEYESQFARVEALNATSAGAYVRWRATSRSQWYLSYSYDRDYEFINPDLDSLHTVRIQFQYRW